MKLLRLTVVIVDVDDGSNQLTPHVIGAAPLLTLKVSYHAGPDPPLLITGYLYFSFCQVK